MVFRSGAGGGGAGATLLFAGTSSSSTRPRSTFTSSSWLTTRMLLRGIGVGVTPSGRIWKPTRWVLGSTIPSLFLSAGGQISEAGVEWRLMVKLPVSNSSVSRTLETGLKGADDLVL